MSIRIGDVVFPVKSAELRYTCVPDGTIDLYLEIEGADLPGTIGPRLTLSPPPVPGRCLADLTGQELVIASPTRPDPFFPGSVNVVAGIYIGTHEDIDESRITWGPSDERGIVLRWTGVVDDLEYYDGSAPRRALVVETHVPAVETPHEPIRWILTHANEQEYPLLEEVRPDVIARVGAELTAQRWFDGLPFVSVDIVVQVDGRGRRWPTLPTLPAGEPPLLLVRITRDLVRAGDADAVRKAIEAELASALEGLARRFRQGTPRLLDGSTS